MSIVDIKNLSGMLVPILKSAEAAYLPCFLYFLARKVA